MIAISFKPQSRFQHLRFGKAVSGDNIYQLPAAGGKGPGFIQYHCIYILYPVKGLKIPD